jgi:hypothetical protein
MNDMRKQARSHIARLRHVYSLSQAKEKDRDEEQSKLRTQSTEFRDLIHSLKDDTSRKAKLLSTMREAKMSDNAALDHWQNEAYDAEVYIFVSIYKYMLCVCIYIYIYI